MEELKQKQRQKQVLRFAKDDKVGGAGGQDGETEADKIPGRHWLLGRGFSTVALKGVSWARR